MVTPRSSPASHRFKNREHSSDMPVKWYTKILASIKAASAIGSSSNLKEGLLHLHCGIKVVVIKDYRHLFHLSPQTHRRIDVSMTIRHSVLKRKDFWWRFPKKSFFEKIRKNLVLICERRKGKQRTLRKPRANLV